MSDTAPLVSTNLQWTLGYITISIIVVVYAINFSVMVMTTVGKIKNLVKKFKIYKARKALIVGPEKVEGEGEKQERERIV